MANPIVLHVVRPYADEQEYLLAEAWSIESRSMVLIDLEELPANTAVLFDVTLAGGQKPIRAEGRVVGVVAPSAGRPGGLKVRFKRFGAATKAFIERAVEVRKQAAASAPGLADLGSAPDTGSAPDASSAPAAASPPEAEATTPVSPSAEDSEADGDRFSAPEVRPSMTDLEPPPASREPSGVRRRIPGPVDAPANREELLERLRQRRRAG